MAAALRIGAVLLLVGLLAGPAEAQQCSGCGCRGGPGYRKPNGQCASWAELDKACGRPPTLKCTAELVNPRTTTPQKPKPQPKPKAKPRT